jgi:hypothetical protein
MSSISAKKAFHSTGWLSPAGQLLLSFGSKRSSRRQQMRGFQKSRFSGSIAADQQVQASSRLKDKVLVQTKRVQLQAL